MSAITEVPILKRVYWETTAACNLRCIHCRRIDVLNKISPEEINLEEACQIIDDLASMGHPVFILSGGEPLYRKDIFEIAAYAKSKGLPVALSTNGTLVTQEIARKAKEAGIYYASISLDGGSARTHDYFRGQGMFARAILGLKNLQSAGIKVQINFTITKQNVNELQQIYDLSCELKAHALYLFLLVPVGCGIQIATTQMLSPEEVEKQLEWIDNKQEEKKIEVRAICAPQYYRVSEQRKGNQSSAGKPRLGCLAGINICFISHKGDVFPCGYLPAKIGNIKETPISELWKNSAEFRSLRDPNLLEGKCGICGFKEICGGCRARGYYPSGNILAEEPYCLYEPANLFLRR